MNRIAVLAAKYVRDPVKAVEDLESFRERVWDVVEFDHERKEWRYSLPTDEACSFYVQFDDCVRAVGLAKERNETLAEFSFDKWRAAVLSVNPMGISDGSGARRDFVSAMSNTYDDLQLIKTKMELSRLLDTGDSVRKSRKSPRKNGRPPRAKLTPKQLEQIHRRCLDGESIMSIFRSYKVDFSYDTFLKLYYVWRDSQGEGQRSKEQKRH